MNLLLSNNQVSDLFFKQLCSVIEGIVIENEPHIDFFLGSGFKSWKNTNWNWKCQETLILWELNEFFLGLKRNQRIDNVQESGVFGTRAKSLTEKISFVKCYQFTRKSEKGKYLINCCSKCFEKISNVSKKTLGKWGKGDPTLLTQNRQTGNNKMKTKLKEGIIQYLGNQEAEESHYWQSIKSTKDILFLKDFDSVKILHSSLCKSLIEKFGDSVMMTKGNKTTARKRKKHPVDIGVLEVILKQTKLNGKFLRVKKYKTDVCDYCFSTKLKIQELKAKGKESKELENLLEYHQLKSKYGYMLKNGISESIGEVLDLSMIIIDYSTKLGLPHLVNQPSLMYRSSHISCTPFVGYINDGEKSQFIYKIWNELDAQNGSDDSVSCLVHFFCDFRSAYPNKRKLYVVMDNCSKDFAGNLQLQFFSLLVLHGIFDFIMVHRLEAGHTYMEVDAAGGLVKKLYDKRNSYVPDDIIDSAREVKSCSNATILQSKDFFNQKCSWNLL